MTEPRIETMSSKKLVGKQMRLPLMSPRTQELWRSFMPDLGQIRNRTGNELISMQVYDPGTRFNEVRPHTEVYKWATAEVSSI